MAYTPTMNAFAVVDKTTGNQLMLVLDAHDIFDPSFNPPNSIQLPIDIGVYPTLNFEALDVHIIQLGVARNITVQSQIAPSIVENSVQTQVLL
jgi:hypothetical protein